MPVELHPTLNRRLFLSQAGAAVGGLAHDDRGTGALESRPCHHTAEPALQRHCRTTDGVEVRYRQVATHQRLHHHDDAGGGRRVSQ